MILVISNETIVLVPLVFYPTILLWSYSHFSQYFSRCSRNQTVIFEKGWVGADSTRLYCDSWCVRTDVFRVGANAAWESQDGASCGADTMWVSADACVEYERQNTHTHIRNTQERDAIFRIILIIVKPYGYIHKTVIIAVKTYREILIHLYSQGW